MNQKKAIARIRAINYQIGNNGRYIRQRELEELIAEREELEKIRDDFAKAPTPPKSIPKKASPNPYKFDNTYPCHDFEPFMSSI